MNDLQREMPTDISFFALLNDDQDDITDNLLLAAYGSQQLLSRSFVRILEDDNLRNCLAVTIGAWVRTRPIEGLQFLDKVKKMVEDPDITDFIKNREENEPE